MGAVGESNPSSSSSPALPLPSKPFNFSKEPPPMLSLSSDQFRKCSRALEVFKNKLQNSQLIDEEFNCIWKKDAGAVPELCGVALNHNNLAKNRYTDDCIPFDSTRVILTSSKDRGPLANDYINASFIKSPIEGSPQFIATQGPLPCTFEDFWEMVLQYRCPAIVMLTCLVDSEKRVKCHDYFQEEEGPRKFGNISVTTNWMVETESSLVLRLLEVTKEESEEKPLSVLHIQYPGWPDHGVPEYTLAVREIFRITHSLSPGVGPIVVHCSAGVGRTGTYCVIHDTTQRILAGDMTALDVASTLTVFRSQRSEMVQNEDQFLFCYEAIFDELEELIFRYNADNRLTTSEDVERAILREEPSDETETPETHPKKRPRVH